MRYGLGIAAITLCSAALGAEVRLSNDTGGGYISAYTLATGIPYSDPVVGECSISRGRQNEPAVAVNPRNPLVLIGSSNDYCGVYAGAPPFVASGPVWLGYYRSENGGVSFQSSLVPGYPGDTSPYAMLAQIRTASSGDPVIAWDGHGRVFMGAESSDDPAGTKKSFGDVWVATFDNPGGESDNTLNDGKRYRGTVTIAQGSSAPNFLGKFQDKTALEADRTGGPCDANVYFAWTSFSGNAGDVSIYFARSTNHGATWSHPTKVTPAVAGVQDPSIAVTGNGNVYVTYHIFASVNGQPDGVGYAKSTDCGRTFGPPQVLVTFTPYEARDVHVDGSSARDCGDAANACTSGYTFFRRDSSPRAVADQIDKAHEYVFLVYEASKPGTQVSTGTSYGSVRLGTGSQSGVYFVVLDGATGVVTPPVLVDSQTVGHQFFPAISADGGVLHLIWWDSRNDPAYSPMRPVGNDGSGKTYASLDVYGTQSTDRGATWAAVQRISEQSTNPNYEQFSDRTVPFAGDYLWVTSLGSFAFTTWTDWRNVLTGTDPREPAVEQDAADVKQCRMLLQDGSWSGDQCPRDGGLDQNIYGKIAP